MIKISDDKLNNKMTELANAMRAKFNKTNKLSVKDMITTVKPPSHEPWLYSSTTGNVVYQHEFGSIQRHHDSLAFNMNGAGNVVSTTDVMTSSIVYPNTYDISVDMNVKITHDLPLVTVSGGHNNSLPNYTGGGNDGSADGRIDNFEMKGGWGHIAGWHVGDNNSATAHYHWIIILDSQNHEIYRFTTPLKDSADVQRYTGGHRTSNHCRFDAYFPIFSSRLAQSNYTIVLRYSDAYGNRSFGPDMWIKNQNYQHSDGVLFDNDFNKYYLNTRVSLGSVGVVNSGYKFEVNGYDVTHENNMSWRTDTKQLVYSSDDNDLTMRGSLPDNQLRVDFRTDYPLRIYILGCEVTITEYSTIIYKDGSTNHIGDISIFINSSPTVTNTSVLFSSFMDSIMFNDFKENAKVYPGSLVLLYLSIAVNSINSNPDAVYVGNIKLGSNPFYRVYSDSSYLYSFNTSYDPSVTDNYINFYGYAPIVKEVDLDSYESNTELSVSLKLNNNETSYSNQNINIEKAVMNIIPAKISTVDVNFTNVNGAYQKLGKAFRNYYNRTGKMTVDDMIKLLKQG